MSAAPSSSTGLPRLAIVVSRYNASITDAMLRAAVDEYTARGGRGADLVIVESPGSFELPVLALAAIRDGGCAAAVALGCLIRGETRHDRYIAAAVAHGLTEVSIRTGAPVGFGVLTVDKPGQARDRAGGKKGNKGREAMAAVLDALGALRQLPSSPSTADAHRSSHDKYADSRSDTDHARSGVGGLRLAPSAKPDKAAGGAAAGLSDRPAAVGHTVAGGPP